MTTPEPARPAETDAIKAACGCGFSGCHHEGYIPLPRDRWPSIGDEVLYQHGDGSGWSAATVVAVAEHDGDLELDTGDGMNARDVKHRAHPWGWLFYAEAAAVTTTGQAGSGDGS